MSITLTPQVGAFGLVRIPGFTGSLVSAGQRLIGSGSHYTHAFIYMGNAMVVQAEPGGARMRSLASAGIDPVYSAMPLSDAERLAITTAAFNLIGTPYSFLDYAAIGANRLLHLDALERYEDSTHHMICSQLVVECYRRAGIELFAGRSAGDIVPGDLAHLIGA